FCDHKRALKYYAESVNNPTGFLAVRCKDWFHFLIGACYRDHAYMGIAANN
ncbi:hypothetical protein L9F63_020763, partial [Diploptera punctata]